MKNMSATVGLLLFILQGHAVAQTTHTFPGGTVLSLGRYANGFLAGGHTTSGSRAIATQWNIAAGTTTTYPPLAGCVDASLLFDPSHTYIVGNSLDTNGAYHPTNWTSGAAVAIPAASETMLNAVDSKGRIAGTNGLPAAGTIQSGMSTIPGQYGNIQFISDKYYVGQSNMKPTLWDIETLQATQLPSVGNAVALAMAGDFVFGYDYAGGLYAPEYMVYWRRTNGYWQELFPTHDGSWVIGWLSGGFSNGLAWGYSELYGAMNLDPLNGYEMILASTYCSQYITGCPMTTNPSAYSDKAGMFEIGGRQVEAYYSSDNLIFLEHPATIHFKKVLPQSDITVWRPGTGQWFVLPANAPGTYTATQWGLESDKPMRGDFDGDGKYDIALWRPSTGIWYVLPSNSPGTYTAAQWGQNADIPATGDFDGDGKDDMAVFRSGGGIWYVLPSSTPGIYTTTQWGTQDDVPVPGDYDGDTTTDIAVWRPSSGIWYILKSSVPGTYTAIQWGLNTDKPAPGDYNGDGKTDVAVWRPGTGIWYVLPSGTPGTYIGTQWGGGSLSDVPVPGDFDGDRKTDIAVWRSSSGIWFILPSNSPGSYMATQWGVGTDVPISPLTQVLRTIP